MTAVTIDCQGLTDRLESYLDQSLDALEVSEIEAHLSECAECSESLQYSRAVKGLLEYIQIDSPKPVRAEPTLTFMERLTLYFSGAPWWGVSLSLHAMVVLLASLLTMAVRLPDPESSVIMVTELAPRQTVDLEAEKPEAKLSALESKHDTPPTDPNSKELSDIVVPIDILQRAELGDHFETNNPDRPDTQSAFGNADAHMFFSERGSDDAAGGGGLDGGSALDGLIGVGGPAGAGTGGGWGGGDGTGMGVDKGAGHGSFGNRNGGGRRLMVKKHGGNKATEGAVDSGLRWLAYHQEADGHWDSLKHGAKGAVVGGRQVDTADTGLALLAFLGAGHTEKVGEYKDNVKRAVAWLRSKQRENGQILGDAGMGYSVAIASLAMAEAAGMANVKETREAAQKAIDYCVDKYQCGEGSQKLGWRYGEKTPGDTSVTGWFIMALKSAKVAGLKVDPFAFDGAIKFLDSVESKDPGAANSGYGPASKYGYTAPNNGSHRTSAIGCLGRQFLGWKKEDLQSSVELFVSTGGYPSANAPGGIDLYYWYYGSLCTFQQGGEIWKKWNEALKKTLPEMQCKVGDDLGSWDPAGFCGVEWGRVGQTALSCLCLEVYYRYMQLTPDQ